MRVIVPFLKPGLATNIRQHWACRGGVLPEPVVCENWRIEPGPDVVVKEVQFASVSVRREEPWVVVWLDLEIPDGSAAPIEFQKQNQKLTAIIPEHREAARQRIIALSKAPKPNDEIEKEHATALADSVPDEVTP